MYHNFSRTHNQSFPTRKFLPLDFVGRGMTNAIVFIIPRIATTEQKNEQLEHLEVKNSGNFRSDLVQSFNTNSKIKLRKQLLQLQRGEAGGL